MSGGLRRSMENKAPDNLGTDRVGRKWVGEWGRENFAKSIRASCPFYLWELNPCTLHFPSSENLAISSLFLQLSSFFTWIFGNSHLCCLLHPVAFLLWSGSITMVVFLKSTGPWSPPASISNKNLLSSACYCLQDFYRKLQLSFGDLYLNRCH